MRAEMVVDASTFLHNNITKVSHKQLAMSRFVMPHRPGVNSVLAVRCDASVLCAFVRCTRRVSRDR